MSIVTYQLDNEEYSFSTALQLKDISLVAAETILIELIKTDKRKRLPDSKRTIHNITIVDDNGYKAVAKNFSELGNLTLVPNETDNK